MKVHDAIKMIEADGWHREVRAYRFLVVIEKADRNYSAYAPDLPGCVAAGRTVEETERNMHQAIEMHVRGLLEDNLPVL